MSTPNIYDLGDQVTLTGRFFSDANLATPADPTTVTLSIRDPNRLITTPTPVHGVTGVWTYAWTPTVAGLHEVNWTGTGAVVSADQEAVYVKVGIALGTDLCSVDEVKLALEITSSADDSLIPQLITAASRAITVRYQREFCPMGTLTRTFEVDGDTIDLNPYDLQSISAISLYPEGTPQAVVRYTDYDLRPVGQTTMGTYTSIDLSGFLVVTGSSVFRFGYANIAVTGVWGAPAIPPEVSRAAIITVGSWRDRAVNQYAVQGIEAGRDMTPDMFTTYSIPSAAHFLLKPYERMSYV